jgi:hypothetical protein
MYQGPSAEASTVAGPGLGAWVGVSPLGRAEVCLGPLVGVHVEPNLNTGVGVRDRNLDVHLLGAGVRVGADGLEINTPLGGLSFDCLCMYCLLICYCWPCMKSCNCWPSMEC